MEFNFIERQELVVWLYTLKNTKTLKRYGQIHYISKKMKYAILYVDKVHAETIQNQLKSLHFVRDVEWSYRDNIDMNFSESLSQEETNEWTALNQEIEEDSLLKDIAASLKKKQENNTESSE